MKKYDISVIGIVGVPGQYGGFETFTDYFVQNIPDYYKIRVFCSKYNYPRIQRRTKYHGADLSYLPIRANGISSVLYDLISLLIGSRNSKNLLVLGVSAGIFLPFIKLISNARIIVNIDGLEWRREKWSKSVKIFLKFSEKLAVKYSDRVVVDNSVLKNYVFNEYKISSQVIAYAGDHVQEAMNQIETKDILEGVDYLSIARIEPENNVHQILEAFVDLADKSIHFIGNWQHSEYSKRVYLKYSNYKNIYLHNPIYDIKNLSIFRVSAKNYIHGHSAGGSNPSLIEATFYGIPILSFDCDFNRATLNNEGYYWKTSQDLKNTITSNLIFGKVSIQSRYYWKDITKDYISLLNK